MTRVKSKPDSIFKNIFIAPKKGAAFLWK